MTAGADIDETNPGPTVPDRGDPADGPMAATAPRSTTAGRITVGYDGSPRSMHALRWAAQRAARTGDQLRVVSCCGARDLSEIWRGPQPGPVSRHDADELLDSARSMIEQRWPDLTPIIAVSTHPAHDQLVNDSATSSLIVVGAPGTRRLDRWRMHPVTRAVVRRSRCPVVLVAGGEELPAKRRVLCGIDGSPASIAALRWAADEADARGVELQIAHVWGYYYPIEFVPVRRHGIARVDHATILNAATEWARERQQGPVIDQLVEGYTHAELLQLASDADLMVLGAGRRPLASTSYRLSIRALCPTVIVPVPVPPPPRGEHGR